METDGFAEEEAEEAEEEEGEEAVVGGADVGAQTEQLHIIQCRARRT